MSRAVGSSPKRTEDPRLLRGEGRFVDDIEPAGTLHAAFVRSPHPHARIGGIDVARARALPGVSAVLTLADLPEALQRAPMPHLVPAAAIQQPRTAWALARDEVCFAGEAVAVVLAEDRYVAEDGAALVEVAYEPLPAVADCRDALAPGAPLAHTDAESNVVTAMTIAYGDPDPAFARAEHVTRVRLFQHRGVCHAMEGRAVLAEPDRAGDGLVLWTAGQAPHNIRRMLVDALDLDEDRVRVVCPDVGGGFGPKGVAYPEEAAIAGCALRLGAPVKWIEDRREHFMVTDQERDQWWDVEAAVDADGRILAIRGTLLHDSGAYLPWGLILPYIAATTFPGPYVIPHLRLDVSVVFTNKVATTPLRGAGRPQAVFAMERLMDRLAQELGLTRDEVRRRNLIGPEQMPYEVGLTYRDGSAVVYDSGDYPACQAAALERADWEGFASRRREALQRGAYRGIGFANYVEGTGLGPFEGAQVRITPAGRVSLVTGAAPQGQGHQTTLAQVCADALGVEVSDVDVLTGDTGRIGFGVGTFASRSAVNAGSSTHEAATQVRRQVLEMAADELEAAPEDLEIVERRVRVRGSREPSVGLGELARKAAGQPGFSLQPGASAGLAATAYFTPQRATYSNGTHVAEVEVDAETGEVTVCRYTVAHDAGRLINPMIVEGQVIGGVAHGIGNALYERMVYDGAANPVTLSLQDYLLPTAATIPAIDLVHLETPTPLNPLGVKGVGEGGTIPAPAAIASAVEDALAPLGVRIAETPLTTDRVGDLVADAVEEAS
jgi:carbon-monoxide dehydrogenase large subunit